MSAAAMAVKCMEQMAKVSRAAPAAIAVLPLRWWNAIVATEPSSAPRTIAAPTYAQSHSMWPPMISAFMPVKCMRLMPNPMTAPPSNTCMREPNEAMEKPMVVARMAMTSDAAVKPGSYAVGRLSS